MLEGIFPIIHVVIILVTSFFILLGVAHTESKGLKHFGRILAFTLWIMSLYIIIFAVYLNALGPDYFRAYGHYRWHHCGMIR